MSYAAVPWRSPTDFKNLVFFCSVRGEGDKKRAAVWGLRLVGYSDVMNGSGQSVQVRFQMATRSLLLVEAEMQLLTISTVNSPLTLTSSEKS